MPWKFHLSLSIPIRLYIYLYPYLYPSNMLNNNIEYLAFEIMKIIFYKPELIYDPGAIISIELPKLE